MTYFHILRNLFSLLTDLVSLRHLALIDTFRGIVTFGIHFLTHLAALSHLAEMTHLAVLHACKCLHTDTTFKYK